MQVDNKPISVGFFDSEIEAANAALAKRLELQTNNLEDQKFKESGIV